MGYNKDVWQVELERDYFIVGWLIEMPEKVWGE
jgi:hypothetical protein